MTLTQILLGEKLMPTIEATGFVTATAAFKDIQKTMDEIKRRFPEAGALCDKTLRLSELGLESLESAVKRN